MESSSSSSPSSSLSSSRSSRQFSPIITQMNEDHLLSILLLLPIESIISFSMTCRKFRSLTSSDSLWEEICRRDWGNRAVDALLASLSTHERREFCWKRLCQRVSQVGLLSCGRLLSKDGISPRPRASHSLNFVSDCLVLFGGGCEGGRHLDDTWVAQIGKGFDRVVSWKQVDSAVPTGRFGHTCTVLSNSLVLFGGINENGIRHNDTWVGQVIQEGSSVTKISWRLLDVESIVPPARGAHAACCYGDWQLVVHGGMGLYGLRLNDTWLLDISDGLGPRWYSMNINPTPPARSGHSITWIGDQRIVLFGGRGAGYEVLNDLWILDMGGDHPKWNELKNDTSDVPRDMPLPRVGHCATRILGRKVLIYGGEDSQRHRKDDFWILDVDSLSSFQTKNLRIMWKKLQVEGHCPNYRSFHSTCTDLAGSCVYVFGGMVDDLVHSTEIQGLRFDADLYLLELVVSEKNHNHAIP